MKRGLKIDPLDNVGIVLEHVEPGDEVVFGEEIVTALQPIDLPHKMALKDIAVGESIFKYGYTIGYATKPIACGEHIHVHNLDSEKLMK